MESGLTFQFFDDSRLWMCTTKDSKVYGLGMTKEAAQAAFEGNQLSEAQQAAVDAEAKAQVAALRVIAPPVPTPAERRAAWKAKAPKVQGPRVKKYATGRELYAEVLPGEVWQALPPRVRAMYDSWAMPS